MLLARLNKSILNSVIIIQYFISVWLQWYFTKLHIIMLASFIEFLIDITKLLFVLKLLWEEALKILFIYLLGLLVLLEGIEHYISKLTKLINFYHFYPVSSYKEVHLQVSRFCKDSSEYSSLHFISKVSACIIYIDILYYTAKLLLVLI